MNWCGTPGSNLQQTEGNFQVTRDNRWDIQIEYARHLAEICGAKFILRYEREILFSSSHNYIVDINSIRHFQKFPKSNEIQFLAATPKLFLHY